MRVRFNQGGYLKRVEQGALRAVVVESNHPAAPLANEPFCTESQWVEYQTPSGQPVAAVHQYMRPDKTLGLSGQPDPKMVLDRGIRYLPDEP